MNRPPGRKENQMYAIFDVRYPAKPFVFQDEKEYKQIPAVFRSKEEAESICSKMNSITTLTTYIVKVWFR